MIHRGFVRYIVLIVTLGTLSGLTTNCTRKTDATYERLRKTINTIKVVNTHEHQRWPSEFEGQPYNFYTLLAYSYLRSDLVSAGAPRLHTELINRCNLDELWEMYGPYLDFSRNTSYYSHFLEGFQVLYDFDESHFTKKGIGLLSEKIAENYRDRETWYHHAFNKAGFEVMFVDQYWNPFNVNLDSRYFALVFHINQLVGAIAERSTLARKDARIENNIYKLAEKEGYAIKTLDDYLTFANHLFDKFLEYEAVCLKNSMAYGRTLDYENVTYEKAKVLFRRSSSRYSVAAPDIAGGCSPCSG